jgi:anti-anti-sigma factor
MSTVTPEPGVLRGVGRANCRSDEALPNTVVATLEGWLDEAGAEMLWEATSPLLDRTTPWLIVDLSRAPLITSAGIGVLVRLQRRVLDLGGDIAVFGAGKRVRELIEVVRLAQVLNLGDSIVHARERLRGGR